MSTTSSGPRRRISDHVHPEYWEESQQHRFEDRIGRELKTMREEGGKEIDALRAEVKKLGDRILLLMGALGLIAFLLPLVAPFIRSLFGGP